MKCRFIKDICLYQGYKNKFKINSVISIKINSGQAIENFEEPTQLYIRVGFSSPTQAPFFMICMGDSTDAGYHPHHMLRPANKIDSIAM